MDLPQVPRLKGPAGGSPLPPRVEDPRAKSPATPRSSPQSPALVPEGVEPVVAGLGALGGDGQQVGRTAAGLDAACKATQISRAAEPASPEPSHPGRARGPQEEQKPVGGGQPSGSGPNRDQWDQAAREGLGLGLREALTAVLGVMAAEGKGEGWGGWAGAQDRGGVHGAGDHSRSRDVLGLEVNAGAGGLVCESRGSGG